MQRLALSLALAFAVGTAFAAEDISKVNSGISIADGGSAGDLDTVNGGIHIGRDAVVESAETVNGGVRLERGARANSVDTVNGGITLDENAIVTGDAETVNGGIELDTGAEVGGRASNVNGGIELTGARVNRGLETVNGDITLRNGARVDGGILMKKPRGWSWGKQRTPRVVIGPNSSVSGDLVFEREVELYVHESASIGTVTGATAKRYSGALPSRDD
jgi:DUF4097 and DUF4098 domain-containing protein YvlB